MTDLAGQAALTTRWKAGALLGLAVAVLAACGADPNVARTTEPVSGLSVGEPGDVSAESLARAMLRVGFTPEEVLELGPGIRRSLTQRGGAEARRGGQLIALFSSFGGRIYVTSERTGTFSTDA